jgi:hypothetical protein
MTEGLAIACIMLAAAFLFVCGCLVVVLALLVAGRALSAAAQGRAHLVQAAAAEREFPDHEPSAEPARVSGMYGQDDHNPLDRRSPDIASDEDLKRAARMQREVELHEAVQAEIMRQAERGDFDVNSNLTENDLLGSPPAMYAGGR